MNYTNRNTIYDYISNETMENGIHSLTLANDETIDFEIVNFSGDTVITPDTIIGNDTADTQMLIMKVAGNLTIEGGVTLTPQTRKKGFVIYADGTITNNGTISMTARGASADGQEVLLYGFNGNYEAVPAVGALGGEAVGGATSVSGNAGSPGTNRALGGGGSGASYSNKAESRSGAGGAATSYSGGAGGGGCASYDSVQVAGDGSSTGGAGGAGASRRTTSNGWNSSGGAGNPGGANSYRTSGAGVGSAVATTSESGTGGLLIIYCRIFKNYGSVESNGSNSGQTAYNPTTHSMTGGASGAGSINIFATSASPLGTLVAKGGIGAEGKTTGTTDDDGNTIYYRGGNGGDGSITYTTMVVGTGNKLIDQTYLSTVLSDMANVIAEELSAIETKINEGGGEGGGSTTTTTISGEEGNAITQKNDGIYVADLSDKVNQLNIAQKTVNDVGTVSLMSEPQSFTITKASTAGTPVATTVSTDIALAGSIDEYDYIEFLFAINSSTRNRPAKVTRFRINTINYNNSTTEDPKNGSIISISFDAETASSGSFGLNHFSLLGWFKDERTFYVQKIFNPVISEDWTVFEITDIIGVKDRSIVIDPLEYVNSSEGIEDTPVGNIITCAATNAPNHYLLCDGTEYNISDYPYLAQHFLNEFGYVDYYGGDGINTFAIPTLDNKISKVRQNVAMVTSNTNNYVVIASSYYSNNFAPWMAFSGSNSSNFWSTSSHANGSSHWLKIDFKENILFNQIVQSCQTEEPSNGIAKFEVLISDDDINYKSVAVNNDVGNIDRIIDLNKICNARYVKFDIVQSAPSYVSIRDISLNLILIQQNSFIKYEPTYFMNLQYTPAVVDFGMININLASSDTQVRTLYEYVNEGWTPVRVNLSDLVVYTNTGADEGYITVEVEGVVTQTINLASSTKTSITIPECVISQGKSLAIKTNWNGTHSGCYWELTGRFLIISDSISVGVPLGSYTDEEIKSGVNEILGGEY